MVRANAPKVSSVFSDFGGDIPAIMAGASSRSPSLQDKTVHIRRLGRCDQHRRGNSLYG